MGLFNKILGFFKPKKDKGGKDITIKAPEPKKIPDDKVDWDRKVRECAACLKEIQPNERQTKQQGKYFHPLCLSTAKKMIVEGNF
jgi:hypothetical protein